MNRSKHFDIVVDAINDLIDPEEVSLEEAKELLEEVFCYVESSLDGVKEDLRNRVQPENG